jgi:4-amino-4-deoxy-L-arabinose transferase-like glycosyltransferase
MRLGGGAYTQEVLQKQLAGRAIGAWVHQSPPWYYLVHSPGFLFPWFAALVAALAARWREERFNINWILAVLVPYSLMSSKLDVYMMAMIPPVALIVAGAVERIRLANVITLAALLLAAIAGPFINIRNAPPLTPLFIVLGVASAIALLVALRGAFASTIALGLVPIVVLSFVALTMMPIVNGLASGKPLVDTLASMHVPADQIALYYSPHLWSHDMPRELEHVHYVSPQSLAALHPTLIVTPRRRAADIAPQLAGFHVVRTVQLIGKPFDVYQR